MIPSSCKKHERFDGGSNYTSGCGLSAYHGIESNFRAPETLDSSIQIGTMTRSQFLKNDRYAIVQYLQIFMRSDSLSWYWKKESAFDPGGPEKMLVRRDPVEGVTLFTPSQRLKLTWLIKSGSSGNPILFRLT